MKSLPQFTPVIHVQSDEQALDQAQVAFDNGADGIFLIDHRRSHRKLLATYEVVRWNLPHAWIGLNFLDLSALDAIKKVPQSVDGLWMDSVVGVKRQDIRAFNGRYFAGVAFKYQEQPEDLAKAANEVAFLFDVVTTSGDATGVAADPAKLALMRSAIVDVPLALASGVTSANVRDYLPYVSCFLVSTGISRDFHTLDPDKVRELADIIYGYEAAEAEAFRAANLRAVEALAQKVVRMRFRLSPASSVRLDPDTETRLREACELDKEALFLLQRRFGITTPNLGDL